MKNMAIAIAALGAAWLGAACGGGGTPPPTTANTATTASSPPTFAAQVAAGRELYTKNCASCHGGAGEGTSAPPVVGLGKGALPLDPPPSAKYRKTQFKTVADVAAFVVKNMPPGAAGSLTEDQYWSILAFDLKANGIDLGDKKLTPELTATLEIPRK